MALKRGFTLIELMIVVAILAILSVVAVPAFIKYMRRAKTVEAIDELDKLHKSAATYYARGSVLGGAGTPIPCQFPSEHGITPDVSNQACCGGPDDADSDDRCDVTPDLWTDPTWSALNFQMSDQHYFGYSFYSTGVVADARFTARANADLDCDGILSTFERYGYGSADAHYAECSMQSSSAYYMSDETE